MSGHSVSADREKVIRPMVLGPASPNGHRQRAPEVIAEIASGSIGSPLLAGQNEPARPCREQLGCRDAGAHPRCGNAEFSRPAAAFKRIRGVRT